MILIIASFVAGSLFGCGCAILIIGHMIHPKRQTGVGFFSSDQKCFRKKNK